MNPTTSCNKISHLRQEKQPFHNEQFQPPAFATAPCVFWRRTRDSVDGTHDFTSSKFRSLLARRQIRTRSAVPCDCVGGNRGCGFLLSERSQAIPTNLHHAIGIVHA